MTTELTRGAGGYRLQREQKSQKSLPYRGISNLTTTASNEIGDIRYLQCNAASRGVQYVHWVMHKCIMVKVGGEYT